jgi:hypothetical protein
MTSAEAGDHFPIFIPFLARIVTTSTDDNSVFRNLLEAKA